VIGTTWVAFPKSIVSWS